MAEEKRIYTVSTAHLDATWRWELKDIIKKHLPDTIRNNFYLLQSVPGYTFNFQGAYRYHLIEEYYPDLFEQIKDYVRHGQWHVSGSAYENGDANLPSPEALFRNILFGNQYFKEKFGKQSKDLFLPDCFGFGAALPGVIRHANLLGLTTQALARGGAYSCPFDIGVWQGVDGSKVFACTDARSHRHQFKHVRTDPSVQEKLAQNKAAGSVPWTLHLHGNGDKDGSPTLTSAFAVSRAVATNEKGPIKVYSAASDQIFQDLAALPAEERAQLPVCENELVTTSHGVGSYTSRTLSKRLNRKNEILADMAERTAVAASYLTQYAYPRKAFNEAWKRVITHQLHDDLGGTSKREVYNRAWDDYVKSLLMFRTELTGAAGAVANELDTSFVQGVALIVSNSVAAPRRDAVRARVHMLENSPYVKVFDKDGKEVNSQVCAKRGKSFDIVFCASVPSLGYTVYDVRPSGTKCSLDSDLNVTEHALENGKYRLRFNKNGDIGSVVDKELERELLDKPIKFALLKDIGALNAPAWELRYEDVMNEPAAYAHSPVFNIVANGPAEAAIEITRTANGSTFVQRVSLTTGGRFLSVENVVDWQSRRTLLKLQFPFTAKNEMAVYDLGLGTIARPTNTKQLYEVPAQKWADLSSEQEDFGISVFSDSRYGWDKPDDHTLRLTCMHTPAGAFTKETRQDLQDLGTNRFGFALFSHSGDYTMGTQLQSEFYAYPLTAYQTTAKRKGPYGAVYSFGESNDRGVLIRAVKKAEDTDELIVRVNEGIGLRHKEVTLRLGDGIESAREVYASEEPLRDAVVQDGALLFNIERYEVKTFALTLTKPVKKGAKERFEKLDLPFNADVITDNQNRQSAIMAASGTSLPLALFPESVTCGGVTFKLGRECRPYNALIPREQTIPLPQGYHKLYLLAASVRGDKPITFLVDHKPRIVTIHDFAEPVGQWELYGMAQKTRVKNDAVPALEFTHTHSPEDDNYGEPAEFFLYEIDIKNGKELKLPYENTVVILAMTAVKKFSATKLVTTLTDTAVTGNKEPVQPDLADKVMDKLDFLTIRAGKFQDQVKGRKGKEPGRNHRIANLVRSYTKNES